ncbi:MAG: potassium channel family protein, partial [Acidimicrobiia bacterium]
VQTHSRAAVDFVYFSFTTLTTTGYGDLTSRLDLGRMLAISEALLGQLYLVSVVALLVANLGRPRRASR